MIRSLLLSSFVLSFALLTTAHAQNKKAAAPEVKPAAMPEVPEILKPLNATITNRNPVGLTLTIESKVPLSAEQWNAIAALKLHSFSFTGAALDDAGMPRLAMMNPEAVALNGSSLTGNGVAKFGEMKSLKTLHTMHVTRPTPEAKAALSVHPALEVFSSDGAFGIEAITAPHLQRVDMKHGAASDEFVLLLKNHPSLESVRLWAKGYAGLSDAALATLVSIPKLKQLSLEFSVFTYAGGLNRLKELPNLATLDLKDVALSDADLAKLKADLPKVKITYTPMTPEYRTQWDAMMAKKK
ncbi:MAG: hypothetical protein RL693_495 [Verrucomicrobiota bacterium]|jgi:hypothetical protein